MEPLISLCMIVRNEESVLRKCLESVEGIVQEIIIVDTGSSDNTRKIANEFTHHIFDFTWTNNFSEARNFAASKASGKWILVLDADEFVERENLMSFFSELRNETGEIGVFLNNIINFTGENGEGLAQHVHSRIYRNDGTIEFHRAIHEQLRKKDGSQATKQLSSLVIYHTGYMEKRVKEKKKFARNNRLVIKELNKNRSSGFDYFNLGNELKATKRFEEALDAYVKAYKQEANTSQLWIPICVMNLTECLVELKRFNQALDFLEDVEQVFSEVADIPFLKGYIYYLQYRYRKSEEVFLSILANKQQYTKVIKSPEAQHYLPAKFLSAYYEKEKNFPKAIEYSIQAINYKRDCFDSVSRLTRILLGEYNQTEVSDFLFSKVLKEKYYQFNFKLLIYILNLGYSQLAELMTDRYFNENEMYVNAVNFKANIINGNNQNLNKEHLDEPSIIEGLRNNIIDIPDLFILMEQTDNNEVRKELQKILSNSHLKIMLRDKQLNSPYILKEEEKTSFLSLFEKCIVYQKFEMIDWLIDRIRGIGIDLNAQIANIFFNHSYENLAIEFYQLADEQSLNKDDYCNIIEWLIFQGEYSQAVDICLKAMNRFPDNECFKDFIENCKENID
ncbi:glycosyltransferase family 2 protein [Mesobacillus subterraneus]|uniref:glycosyltransferase family 2 protein n=1 Tax=Mesobacillus subterraneus TaxID=285983 RepID=UPI001CFEDC2B|nr:glycosyltransferase family 2 protein [Mesobacillus subterraneus]